MKLIRPISLLLCAIPLVCSAVASALASTNPYISRHGINFSTGNKYLRQNDISLSGPIANLSFSRNYNSQSVENGALGFGWSFTLNDKLSFEAELGLAIYQRADGHLIHFTYNGTDAWVNDIGPKAVITNATDGSGHILTQPDGSVLRFDLNGRLVEKRDRNNNTTHLAYDGERLSTVSDGFGRSLSLVYNNEGKLASIRTPVGNYTYGYANDNLTSVSQPDGTSRTYLYEDPNDSHNLTGVLDETGARIQTVAYDLMDRVISSSLEDGREAVAIEYQSGYKRKVTNSLGAATTYQLEVLHGVAQVKSFTGPGCSSCGSDSGAEYIYDFRQQVTSMTDRRGVKTTYTYDGNGNKLTETNAVGTPEAFTTTYAYNALNQVESIRTPSVIRPDQYHEIVMTYDATGNLINRQEKGFSDTAAISRATSYTYDTYGRVTAIDGPRTDVNDVTTLTYYPNEPGQGANRGFLHTVSNALGQNVTYTNYNAFGQAESIVDANGLATEVQYNARGLVTQRTTGGLATSYDYDDAGNILTVILPGARTISYVYTPAGQVGTISDGLGNSISYDYDSEGKKIGQRIKDPEGTLTTFVNYQYDDNGRLQKTISPDNSEEQLAYDQVGNLITKIDALSRQTNYSYDALNRLAGVEEPMGTSTRFAYDVHGNQTTVTDAQGHITTYTYDDFGRRLSRTAPDTGLTTYSYDWSDNLVSSTNANGATTTYSYDILNRLSAISYPDSSRNVVYTYDQGASSIGRLTSMQDATGATTYQYDSLGRLHREQRSQNNQTFTTTYTYNDNSELAGITYPSGRVIIYNRNAIGQVTSITTTYQGTTETITDNISHLPFGPTTSMTLGNGLVINNDYDQLYRLTNTTAGSLYDRDYTYLATGNVRTIANNIDQSASQDFTYDDLGRLVAAQGKYGTLNYSYDTVGNRLNKTENTASTTYTYEADSNRLAQTAGTQTTNYTYDPAGNIINKGSREFAWSDDNRLLSVADNANIIGQYGYDGRGLRTIRTADNQTVLSVYDQSGNMLVETDDQGNTLREFVYLDGTRITLFDYTLTPDFTVEVTSSTGRALDNVNTYAFNAAGAYSGISAKTNANGSAIYNRDDFIASGNYSFRVDYLGTQFWSSAVAVQQRNNVQVMINEEPVQLTVTLAGSAQAGVRVYVFSEAGSYLGIYGTTDSNGLVIFNLPEGYNYKFRADLLGSQYWSETTTVQDGGSSVTLATGGGLLNVTLAEEASLPLGGIKTYLFSQSGSYLGLSATSNSQGQVSYPVSNGTYKIRVDYLGYQLWTPDYVVSAPMQAEFMIPHRDIEILVSGDMNGDVRTMANVPVYLFTPSGSYLGLAPKTDQQGKVVLHVPEKEYKVRADYLGRQYWSNPFTWQDTPVAIAEGMAEITVTNQGTGVAGVSVYVFSDAGTYLGLSGTSDAQGDIAFRLPAGVYTFRADYQGSQYWSGNTEILGHRSNPVTVSTGGGSFVMTVLAAADTPLAGVQTYLFSASGSYLGVSKATDNQGQVGYNLADGDFKIRIDYLGYQYWSDPIAIPETSSLEYLIPHRDVVVTASHTYANDPAPITGAPVYLFTHAGSYVGQSRTTDAAGRAVFSLPARDYKVRVDYLGQQFWSMSFNQLDTEVIVDDGIAEIHLESGGAPLGNVPVYVFSGSGSYLGLTANTSAAGIVSFRLPAGGYKFRADYQGKQFWAAATIAGQQTTPVDLNTGGGTLSVTVKSGPATVLANVPCYLFSGAGAYLGQTAKTDSNGTVTFAVADGDYKVRVDYFKTQFWSKTLPVPNVLADTVIIDHQPVGITVSSNDGTTESPLPGVRCYLFTATGTYTGVFSTTDQNGVVNFNVPFNSYKVRADYLGSEYWSAVFDWLDTTIAIDHGDISLHVTDLGADVAGAAVYLFSSTGTYLGRSTTTDGLGAAFFTVPAKGYKLRVDRNGKQYWTDVINVIAYQDNPVSLALEALAQNLTHDPDPARYDGEGPVYMPRIASIGPLTGLLAQAATQALPSTEARQFYYISDHLGTAQLLVDDTGAVAWQGDSSPFGEVDIPVNTLDNAFRFPGQYFDAETGLHYNWNRYYDPTSGRYLSADPIGLDGGMNLYAYVNGNPVNAVDLTGEIAISPPAVIGATIVLGGAWIYMQSHPEAASQIADAISRATDKCDDESCDEIIKKIYEVMRELNKRYLHQCRNKKGLWESHVPAFEGKKRQLAKLVAKAEAKGCAVPPKAYEWLNATCPAPGTPFDTTPGY